MRWFKKKPVPFDDNFTIITESPPDYIGIQELRFKVPSNYYAQLLSANLTIAGPAIGGMRVNFLILQVTRGGTLLYQAVSEGAIAGGSVVVSASIGVNAWMTPPSASRLFWTVRLPDSVYLYPFDLIRVFIPQTADNYALTNLIVVMKQWKTD